MHSFLLCFIPLFVAIDPVGLLPVFVSVTTGYTPQRRRRLVAEAVPTAAVIGVAFFLLGRLLLGYLNIGVADLRIAGGALLFMYALVDLFVPG
jgi:multiple antibiotic resistance protein